MARFAAWLRSSGGPFLALCALTVACGAENTAGDQKQPPCEAATLLNDPISGPGTGGTGDAAIHLDKHHAERWACAFKPNDTPAKTVTGDIQGLRDKIKHVFVLMLENRSFDQYLSQLPQANIYSASDVDVATNQTNPRRDGTAVERYATDHLCLQDLNHEWLGSHVQFDNGLNDGFVVSGGKRAMAYYQQEQLKFHYFLADKFVATAISLRSWDLRGPIICFSGAGPLVGTPKMRRLTWGSSATAG